MGVWRVLVMVSQIHGLDERLRRFGIHEHATDALVARLHQLGPMVLQGTRASRSGEHAAGPG